MSRRAGGRTRFPGSVYLHGEEPDARFTMANERTFLAWTRTALALIAGGVALEVIDLNLHPGLTFAAAMVLIVSGILTPALAWVGWVRSERAIRLHEPLPGSMLAPLVAVAVMLAGVLVLLAALLWR